MTRIVTGQLDAVVEVGSRMIDDVPGLRAEFEALGGGQVLNNSPYDLAGPWLCLREAGGVISDGWGAARRSPAARLRPRVSDVVDLGLHPAAARRARASR